MATMTNKFRNTQMIDYLFLSLHRPSADKWGGWWTMPAPFTPPSHEAYNGGSEKKFIVKSMVMH